jgi:hypothetical protein
MDKRKFICEQKDGSYIYATKEQIEEAKTVEKELASIENKIAELTKRKKTLTAGCKHEVSWDEPGHPYDVRHCVKCGHTSLL